MNCPMNMSLRQLRYLVAAADCGHVTAAAKRLNVSQPSISSAIAEVESRRSACRCSSAITPAA